MAREHVGKQGGTDVEQKREKGNKTDGGKR